MIMEQKKTRKEGIKRGTVTQRMMSFRIDEDCWEYLKQQPNKGRFINELIKKSRE